MGVQVHGQAVGEWTYLFWESIEPGKSFSFLFLSFSLSFRLSRYKTPGTPNQ